MVNIAVGFAASLMICLDALNATPASSQVCQTAVLTKTVRTVSTENARRDPVANEGCEGGDDVPPICARQNVGALCVACVNDTECAQNGTYCDEISGQCRQCPENHGLETWFQMGVRNRNHVLRETVVTRHRFASLNSVIVGNVIHSPRILKGTVVMYREIALFV